MQLPNKIGLTLLAAAAVSACSTTEPLQVTTKPVELSIIQPPDPQPVSMLDVKLHVVTSSNMDDFLKQAAKEQGTDAPVFVVMSTKGYEAVSLNVAELKRFIMQQKQIIAYYKKATARHIELDPPKN
jgi:hypothetical protein